MVSRVGKRILLKFSVLRICLLAIFQLDLIPDPIHCMDLMMRVLHVGRNNS